MANSEIEDSAKKAMERYKNIDSFSPMMRHYITTKAKYPDCILCYRLGDFFEMFFEDAIICSRELELTLTGKDCGQQERAPMCGIPHHAIDSYISKMVSRGYKVAICEQLEDPSKAKGIVKRDVIKVVTPGTNVEGTLAEEKKNNFIMSIYKEGMYFGLAVCDISTGDFYTTEIKEDNNFNKLIDEISRFTPSEIIVNSMMAKSEDEIKEIQARFNTYISEEKDKDENDIPIETPDDSKVDNVMNINKDAFAVVQNKRNYWNTDNEDNFSNSSKKIKQTFEIFDKNNNVVDIDKKEFAICAINGLMNYIEKTQKQVPENLNRIIFYETKKYMSLDINARRNLEITEKMRDKSKKGTLLWVLDKTKTAMGGRLLIRWLNDPLIDKNDIQDRLDAVEEIKDNMILRDEIIENLKNVYDMERLAGRISYGSANARDLISLKNSIFKLPGMKKTLSTTHSKMLMNLYNSLDTLDDIYKLIDESIVEDPPATIKEGNLIKRGYNPTVDHLIEITANGRDWISKQEEKEREATGIKKLKIGYNKVFGYYIEI